MTIKKKIERIKKSITTAIDAEELEFLHEKLIECEKQLKEEKEND